MRRRLDHGDAAAEAGEGVRHLQPDRAAAQDQQVVGAFRQIEQRRVGQIRHAGRGRGSAARRRVLPAAMTMRRAVSRRPSTISASGATKRASPRSTVGAEGAEARLGIVRRDRGDRAMDVRAHRGPVDLRLGQADAEAAGAAGRLRGVRRRPAAPCSARSRSSGSRRPSGRARSAPPAGRAARRPR